MKTDTRPPAQLVLGVILSVLLAACVGGASQSETSSETITVTSEEIAGSFTDVDTDFLQGMVPHHAQAMGMAEIAQTQGWQQDWGV